MLSESLVRLDKNFKTQPGAATKWEVDSTGLVWTFKLDPNLMWSDDTPVTADDWVATFQYGADPKHAWDFTWYFGGVIKNWDEAVAGKVPLDQLGVKAVDAHTLLFTTAAARPRISRRCCSTASALQKKALDEASAALYNSNPATSVSSGPFILKEWTQGRPGRLRRQPEVHRAPTSRSSRRSSASARRPATELHLLPGQRDRLRAGADLSPADNEIIAGDPQLSKEVHPQLGDFRTDYLFFDYQNPPFNNLKVRQAFSHVD